MVKQHIVALSSQCQQNVVMTYKQRGTQPRVLDLWRFGPENYPGCLSVVKGSNLMTTGIIVFDLSYGKTELHSYRQMAGSTVSRVRTEIW